MNEVIRINVSGHSPIITFLERTICRPFVLFRKNGLYVYCFDYNIGYMGNGLFYSSETFWTDIVK